MSHYINSWCAVHGDLEVDSDSIGCPDCHERWYQCFLAIRDHLGGKPELVGEVVATLRDLWWDGIEGACDECGGDDADCPPNCVIRRARAILSRIENGNG